MATYKNYQKIFTCVSALNMAIIKLNRVKLVAQFLNAINVIFTCFTLEVEKWQSLPFYLYTLPSIALFVATSYVSHAFFKLKGKLRGYEMKILFINDFYSGGGAEVWLHDFMSALNPLGYKMWLATLSKTEDPKHYRLRSILQFPEMKILFILLRRTFFFNTDPLVYLSFRQIFQKINPDIVHCGNLYCISLAPIEYAIAKGTPCIVTLQDPWPICLRRTMVKPNFKICNESNWENCAKCKHRKIGFALSQFIKRGYEKRRKILLHEKVFLVAGNSFIKDSLAKFGYSAVQVIHNGIDVGIFSPPTEYTKREYILFVGRAPKGLFDFLKIAKLYHERYGNDLKFIVIGEKVKASFIESFEWMPRANLVKYYRKALAFLELQYVPPGVGLAPMEAMACGAPIIAYYMPGMEEFVKDGETAFLTHPGSLNDVVEKIAYLKENEDIAQKVGLNASKIIAEHFSKEKMMQKYKELYKKVVSS